MSDQPTYLTDVEKRKRARNKAIEGYVFGGVVVAILAIGGYFVYDAVNYNRIPGDLDFSKTSTTEAATPQELIGYKQVKNWETDLNQVWGVAVTPAGDVWAVGTGGLRLYDPDGNELKRTVIDGTVRTITVRDNGDYYVGIGNRIERYDAADKPLAVWDQLGPAVNVSSIVFATGAGAGKVFVGDTAGSQILRLDAATGDVEKRFGSTDEDELHGLHIPGPHLDLAWYGDRLWVTNPGRHHINVYNVDGKLLSAKGRQGFKFTGYSGCCNPSSLAILPNGNLITTEKGLPRVKVLEPKEGEFISFVVPKDTWRAGGRKHAYAVDVVVGPDQRVYIADRKETGAQLIRIYEAIPGFVSPVTPGANSVAEEES